MVVIIIANYEDVYFAAVDPTNRGAESEASVRCFRLSLNCTWTNRYLVLHPINHQITAIHAAVDSPYALARSRPHIMRRK